MYKIILVSVIVLLFSGCIPKGKFNALTASHNQLDNELIKTRKELADAKRELTKFRDVTSEDNVRISEDLQEKNQTIARLQQKEKESTQQLRDCQQKLDYCQNEALRQAKKAQAQLKALQEADKWKLAKVNQLRTDIMTNLGELFDTATVSLIQEGPHLILELGERLLFPQGSKYVGAGGRTLLERLALVLAVHNDIEINVIGHSVINGDEKNNWKVSTRRATYVVFILAENGVPAKQLILSGRGEHNPLVENTSSTKKAKNQRTEIILTPLGR
ncbi:MAG: OmpA family protein [Aureispira sp.]|nr:OmpA family protein [Aureispira sp.]